MARLGGGTTVALVIAIAAVAGIVWTRHRAPNPAAPVAPAKRLEPIPVRPTDSAVAAPRPRESAPTAPEAPSEAPRPRPQTISGRVVEAGTGAPVARLPLTFTAPGRAGAFATTRDDGTFETRTPVAAGEVIVTDGDSYSGLALSLDPEHRNLVLARLVLEGGKSLENVVIEHPYSGRVAGRVVDGSGAGIAGARVVPYLDALRAYEPGTAWHSPHVRFTTTATDGAFALERLPTDRRLELVAEAPGYSTGFAESFVASPEVTAVADVVLLRPGSLRILVLDAEGAPLPGATARLFWISAADAVVRRTSDDPGPAGEDGVLSFDSLRPGRYAIEARRPPHSFRGTEAATVAEGGRAEVTVRAEAERLDIAGLVSDPMRRPLADGLVVRARRANDDRVVARAEVDSAGRFAVAVPEPGLYLLAAATQALDAGPATEASAGEADVDVSWTAPAASVRLRVLDDATGEPIADAETRLATLDANGSQTLDGHDVIEAASDPRGRTEAFPVAPGRCVAAAAARGRAARRVEFEIHADDLGERTIDIRLPVGRSVSGRVVDSDGHGVQHARVAVVDGPWTWLRTRVYTRVDGTFTIDSCPEDGGELAVVEDAFVVVRAPADPSAAEIVLALPARR